MVVDVVSAVARDAHAQVLFVALSFCAVLSAILRITFGGNAKKVHDDSPYTLYAYWKFFYASFLKPHTGDGSAAGQQAALESFYSAQAVAYDATRSRLLRGREDMLGLVAAQLQYRREKDQVMSGKKPIWVDVSRSTL